MVDSEVVVLSFDYAKIVKDAGTEKFSVVYGAKEKYFDVFDNLSYFGEDICRALFSRTYRMQYDIQFLSAW